MIKMICSKCRSNKIDIDASLICSACANEVKREAEEFKTRIQQEEDSKKDEARHKVWKNNICVDTNGLSPRFKNISIRDIRDYNECELLRLLRASNEHNIIIVNGANFSGKTFLAVKFLYSNYTNFDCSLYYVSLFDIVANNFDSNALTNANYAVIDDIKQEAMERLNDNVVYILYKRLMNSPRNTLLVSTSDAYRDLLTTISQRHSDVISLPYARINCENQYATEEFVIKPL